jgi:hypothetical protein
MFCATLWTKNFNFFLQNDKTVTCCDRHFFSIFSTNKTKDVDIYQIYFIWSKSCLAQISEQKTWISSSKPQEFSFDPIGNPLAYLAQLRPRTSIYIRFISLGASHVLLNFRNEKCEFRPPTRQKFLSPIDTSLAYLVLIWLRTSIYTTFTSFGARHV